MKLKNYQNIGPFVGLSMTHYPSCCKQYCVSFKHIWDIAARVNVLLENNKKTQPGGQEEQGWTQFHFNSDKEANWEIPIPIRNSCLFPELERSSRPWWAADRTHYDSSVLVGLSSLMSWNGYRNLSLLLQLNGLIPIRTLLDPYPHIIWIFTKTKFKNKTKQQKKSLVCQQSLELRTVRQNVK